MFANQTENKTRGQFTISEKIQAISCRAVAVALFASLLAGTAMAQEETWSIEMRQGDTISSIAKRYLINPNDWQKLQQFNKVRLDRAMPVGTRINVPASWMRIVDIDAQIVAVRGKVRIERAGAEVPATVGAAVKVGDRISAAEASSVTLKFSDGTISSLHANTNARIDLMRGVPSTDLIAQRLRLDAGRIEHAVTPRKNSSSVYEIQTPVATIGVRGTKFRTTVDDTSRGEVLEGRVAATGSGSASPVLVGAGFATVIPASGIPSQPIALLPAPDLSKNPASHELGRPAFVFDALPDAEQYRAMLARDAEFADIVSESIGKSPRVQLPTVTDGRYYLRVRGIDTNRIEGRNGEFAFNVKVGNPPPPEALTPEFDSALAGGTTTLLTWAAEKQAASYRFQVDTEEKFSRVLHGALRTASLRFGIPNLRPGRYYWRLASNRADGTPGPWGPVMQFVVGAAPEAAAKTETETKPEAAPAK
ncbi:MAG: FecR domain-containing protein [Burkholderiales bacterium]